MAQDFYWVIGQGTDAGKTTLATALLRALNRRRYPALGFKPYSALLLTVLVDLMTDEGSATRGKIVGEDALDLAMASPLTSAADVECIVPVQYICHPNYHSAIMARVGSGVIGDRVYVRSDHQRPFLDRPDIADLFDRNGTAMREMTCADHLKLASCPSHSQDQVVSAYRRLAAREGVAAVICEGIGQFLPLWRDMPVIDHLFHIGMSTVRFYPNIHLSLDGKPHETLHTSRMVDHLLGDDSGLSAPLPLVPSSQRAQVADEVVESLLQAAKLAQ